MLLMEPGLIVPTDSEMLLIPRHHIAHTCAPPPISLWGSEARHCMLSAHRCSLDVWRKTARRRRLCDLYQYSLDFEAVDRRHQWIGLRDRHNIGRDLVGLGVYS